MLIRLFTLLAAIPLRLWVLDQRLRGNITPQTAKNRLGQATIARPTGPVIWIHAASLGELSAVRPLLSHLVKHHQNHQLLITTNNPAALTVAARWPDIPAILQAAPLDLPHVITRFLDHWQPAAFVNIESEIWPNRFAALARRNIPAIGLNARLSDRSAKNLVKIGVTAGLSHFAAIFSQNAQSTANFRALTGPNTTVETIPNLKSMVNLPDPDPALSARFDRANTILAASTHEGEEPAILEAFAKIAATDPALKLILAPRHPNRAADIAKAAVELGLSPQSLDSAVDSNLFIVDTLGLLPQLYALASVTFVGGSLVPDIGGHTPYEPIRAGSAIITGSFTDNFSAEYATLQAAEACTLATKDNLVTALTAARQTAPTHADRAQMALPLTDNPEELLRKITASLGLQA